MKKFSSKDAELNRAEQDFLNVFSALSEHEKFKVLEDSIRDEEDDSVRQVMLLLLSELKGTS